MSAPLADRIRPKTLDDVVGQSHLLGAGKPLRRIIESGNIPNMIFYGSSGIGKTTVARIIANSTNKKMFKLNGRITSYNVCYTKLLRSLEANFLSMSLPWYFLNIISFTEK